MAKTVQVLVAEDDPTDILLLQRAFRKAVPDAEVFYACNGNEAIETLKHGLLSNRRTRPLHPDLLLLDLGLPIVTGFEILAWLSANDWARPRWVVVLTSSASELDVAQAFRSNVDHYIVKPADPDELIIALKLVISELFREGRPKPTKDAEDAPSQPRAVATPAMLHSRLVARRRAR